MDRGREKQEQRDKVETWTMDGRMTEQEQREEVETCDMDEGREEQRKEGIEGLVEQTQLTSQAWMEVKFQFCQRI